MKITMRNYMQFCRHFFSEEDLTRIGDKPKDYLGYVDAYETVDKYLTTAIESLEPQLNSPLCLLIKTIQEWNNIFIKQVEETLNSTLKKLEKPTVSFFPASKDIVSRSYFINILANIKSLSSFIRQSMKAIEEEEKVIRDKSQSTLGNSGRLTIQDAQLIEQSRIETPMNAKLGPNVVDINIPTRRPVESLFAQGGTFYAPALPHNQRKENDTILSKLKMFLFSLNDSIDNPFGIVVQESGPVASSSRSR